MSKPQIKKLTESFTATQLAEKVIENQKIAHDAEARATERNTEVAALANRNLELTNQIIEKDLRIKSFEADLNKKQDDENGQSELKDKIIGGYKTKLSDQIEQNIMLEATVSILTKKESSGFFGELPK